MATPRRIQIRIDIGGRLIRRRFPKSLWIECLSELSQMDGFTIEEKAGIFTQSSLSQRCVSYV